MARKRSLWMEGLLYAEQRVHRVGALNAMDEMLDQVGLNCQWSDGVRDAISHYARLERAGYNVHPEQR